MHQESMLRRWRRSAGLTQRELARLAVVSRASVSHAECGRTSPSIAIARKISRALSAHLGQAVRICEVFPEHFKPLPGENPFD